MSHANLALLVAQFLFQVEAMDFCDCLVDGGQRSTSSSVNTGLLVSVGVRVTASCMLVSSYSAIGPPWSLESLNLAVLTCT